MEALANGNTPGHTEDTKSNGALTQRPITDTVDNFTNPVKTPFPNPHPSLQPPAAPTLTPQQSTKFESLLLSVRSWTDIPNTSDANTSKSPLTDSERLWLTRECLLRYLRASKWILPTAINRLLATLAWRREYGVEKHTADYISEENETGKQVLLGYDNSGRPCLYLNPHKQNTKDQKKQVQHLVFMLERCIDLMPAGQESLALLVNFTESRNGSGSSVGQGRQALGILQSHYPERMGCALVIEVPWLVWGFLKAISPFFDPATKEKLKFDEDLRKLVPPEQLINSFGGEVEFEYDHQIYWPALIKLAESRRKEVVERWEKAGKIIGESESYLKGKGQSLAAQE